MSHKNQYVKKRRILCLLLAVLLVASLLGIISKRETRGQNLLQVKSGRELFQNRETGFNSSQLICLESEAEEPLDTDSTDSWFDLFWLGQNHQRSALQYYWRSERNMSHLLPIPLKIVSYIHQTDGKKGSNHCLDCFV